MIQLFLRFMANSHGFFHIQVIKSAGKAENKHNDERSYLLCETRSVGRNP
jgi:hypothetical protein